MKKIKKASSSREAKVIHKPFQQTNKLDTWIKQELPVVEN